MHEEESTLTIDEHGDRFWRNKEGNWHRIDGPAIEYLNGPRYWYQNGILHRIDGPAVEWRSGDKSWFYNNIKFSTKEAFFEVLSDKEKEIALFSDSFLNA